MTEITEDSLKQLVKEAFELEDDLIGEGSGGIEPPRIMDSLTCEKGLAEVKWHNPAVGGLSDRRYHIADTEVHTDKYWVEDNMLVLNGDRNVFRLLQEAPDELKKIDAFLTKWELDYPDDKEILKEYRMSAAIRKKVNELTAGGLRTLNEAWAKILDEEGFGAEEQIIHDLNNLRQVEMFVPLAISCNYSDALAKEFFLDYKDLLYGIINDGTPECNPRLAGWINRVGMKYYKIEFEIGSKEGSEATIGFNVADAVKYVRDDYERIGINDLEIKNIEEISQEEYELIMDGVFDKLSEESEEAFENEVKYQADEVECDGDELF